MRAKIIKRWAIFIAVLSLIGGTGFFTQQFQLTKQAKSVDEKADIAVKNGDFAEAERLYREHSIVFPKDVEIKIKHADALLKADSSPRRQNEALQIYSGILNANGGRADVRLKRMQLRIDTEQFFDAEVDLQILLRRPENKDNGHLLFLMGHCCERLEKDLDAERYYRSAIEHDAPDRIEAYQRLATLFRGRLKKPEDADKAIEEMVQSAPKNYLVYLARGRYLHEFGECDLRLMSSVNGVNGIPTEGKNLIIVAAVDHVLHFRIFDGDGKKFVDTDEKRLTKQVRQIEDLRKRLEKLWPPNDLTGSEKGQVITAVTSIVGHTQFALQKSEADFQKALELAEGSPDVYLEMAATAIKESRYEAARQILEVGLKKAPASAAIYMALARLEQGTGHVDQAVKTLERGLESAADKSGLHASLADVLARHGETGKLLLQIEALKKIGYNQGFVQFLTAQYHINTSEFSKALQLLVPLEARAVPQFKTQINNMLARCYGQLGEPARQQEAYVRALSADPKDVTAKLGLIDRMKKQGELEGAIKEYRALVEQVPAVSLPLAQLLIARNRLRPAAQRDWTEIKSLIDAAEKASPEPVEPLIFRAEFYLAQDKYAEARDELEKARSRFPKNVAVWCAQADLMGLQKQFSEARNLLDQAQKELGDSVELRLQRAKLAVAKGGPQVVNDLNDLSQNLEPYTKVQRRKLLNGLATEFQRLQDLPGASRLWSRLAEQEPNDFDLRLKLLEVAFQTANSDEIDKNIKQLEQMEGNDGFLSGCSQVRYLIWQAERATAKEPQEALRLRTKARVLLNELESRRADSSFIPMTLAQLEQQELRQGGLGDHEIQAKEESIIRYYRRAIDLGERNPAIMRETVKLLYKYKRESEATDLFRSIPAESQLAGDLERQSVALAVASKDFQRAEEIARKAVAAKPADFRERLLLVNILLAGEHRSEAETVIREAIALSKNDPARWITLVEVLLFDKQPVKAAQAIKEAEASLPQPQAPMALAQCCELVGKAYEGIDDDKKKQWYAQAKGWYEKAQAAHPDDFSITRRLTTFFLQTNQIAQVEAQLNAILKRGSKPQNAETVAWARRMLALTLASDPKRVRDAVFILEPVVETGQGAKALEDPEDLRVLAKVLAAQNTIQHRERAIKILESAVDKDLANAEDRFLLAHLEEQLSGHWPKALKVYRDLILRTKNPRDLEALRHRLAYLEQFVLSLLRNHKAGDDQDLTEAQLLVDELKQLQPEHLSTLILQMGVFQARNQLDTAADLIQTSAKRSDLAPLAIRKLAELAENLGRFDIAEPLYSRFAALLKPRDGAIVQALFLGRNGHVKDALNLCEPLWANPENVERLAGVCFDVVTSSNDPPDKVQVDRVAGWLEQAIKQKRDSTLLLAALGNCREQQTRYDDAKKLYERVIELSPRNTVASSRMIANSYNNLAWLLALTGAQGKDALVDIDRAINLEGALPDYLDTRGIIYLNLKRTQDAINDLEIAVKADPSPARLFHLAQAYLQANNKEKAKQYWKDAMDKKLDQIRFGPRGLHPLEQLAYQKVRGELGSP